MNSIKSLLVIAALFTLNASAFGQFGKFVDKAKKAQEKIMGDEGSSNIGLGLKEALENGVSSAVDQLSASNGYLKSAYKINVPNDAAKVIKTVKKLPGFGDVEEKLIQKMNEAAEIAAKKATPIFVDAIKGLSFTDAKNILFGEEDAATSYLSNSTRPQLYETFMPVIQSSLDEVNARTYWSTVVEAYNKVPFVSKMNPALDDHVNNKALDGLFSLIQVKETGIRNDVDQRTSPLLRDVFGKLDK